MPTPFEPSVPKYIFEMESRVPDRTTFRNQGPPPQAKIRNKGPAAKGGDSLGTELYQVNALLHSHPDESLSATDMLSLGW